MRDIAVVDRETGDLVYFLIEDKGIVYREYPDGRTEPADDAEHNLMM